MAELLRARVACECVVAGRVDADGLEIEPLHLPDGLPAWLDGLDAFLVDCDGVLWRGNAGIPGVAATYEALRAAGKVRRALRGVGVDVPRRRRRHAGDA